MGIKEFMVENDFLIGTTIFCIFLVLRFIYKKRQEGWETYEIFIHPETGTCYTSKKKDGKYRYYINLIRVPEKFYHFY